jgi:two-component system, LytTR family, response regulator
MNISTVIIEDERNNLEALTTLIKEYAEDIDVTGVAGHMKDAIALIEAKEPDLVFMDIRLADGTCFDVLQRLTYRDFVLIIVTAYNNYALEAIKFSAIDYLLKPVGIPEFEEAVKRARKNISMKLRQSTIDMLLSNLSQQNVQDKMISITTLKGFEFVTLKDIVWCKANSSYTTFYITGGAKIISSRNIGFYEDILKNHHFCRIHNGVIVNMRFVKTYLRTKSGSVTMADGTVLEVSHRRKTIFLQMLQA